MSFYLILALTGFAVGWVLTCFARPLGVKLNILDKPDNYRKVNTREIPLTGGYAIFLTTLIVVAGYILFGFSGEGFMGKYSKELLVAVSGGLLMLVMGGVDDVKDLRPRYKLLVQLIVASFCYFGGFKIDLITVPFKGSVDISAFSYPVTIFWYLGCINAINLLDGLDGLAGGIGLFAILTLLANAILMNNNEFAIVVNAVLAGALVAFLCFNFNPASIFLGDAGSMFVGFMIATMSLLSRNKAETALALAIPFVAIGLPVFDTAVAILRRWSKRVPLSSADKKHVHHILLNMGLSQRKVVLILWGICLLLAAVALLLSLGRESLAMVLFGGILFFAYISSRIAGMLDISEIKNRYSEDRRDKKRSSKAAVEVEKAISRFTTAGSITEMWEMAEPALESLEMDHACLELEIFSKNEKLFWKSVLYDEHHETAEKKIIDEWSLFLKLYSEDNVFGKFEVWKISEQMPIKNICQHINKLRNGFSENIQRLEQEKKEE